MIDVLFRKDDSNCKIYYYIIPWSLSEMKTFVFRGVIIATQITAGALYCEGVGPHNLAKLSNTTRSEWYIIIRPCLMSQDLTTVFTASKTLVNCFQIQAFITWNKFWRHTYAYSTPLRCLGETLWSITLFKAENQQAEMYARDPQTEK